jgi:hypothetical protein
MRYVPLILVASLIAVTAGAQEAPKPREAPKAVKGTKLWAAVSVSDTLLNWGDLAWKTELRPPFMIHFYMVNDGDKVVDPKLASSRLFLNGKECKGKDDVVNWQVSIGRGPRDDRWEALPPGDYLSFTMNMGDSFKEPGTYRVKWKGESFEAPEVVFRVMPRKKAGK